MKKKIERAVFYWQTANPLSTPRYILMDFQSFQDLKLEHYGGLGLDKAFELELEEIDGLKIFYNDSLGISFLEIV